MIENGNPELSNGKQCRLLSISRSSFYCTPIGESEKTLALMRQIDEQVLETPFFGVRQLHATLQCNALPAMDDLASAQRWPSGEREAHPSPDAADGSHGDLPQAQHQHASERAQNPPICCGGCGWENLASRVLPCRAYSQKVRSCSSRSSTTEGSS